MRSKQEWRRWWSDLPLPLGEGRSEGVAERPGLISFLVIVSGLVEWINRDRCQVVAKPHPNPLPKGEGEELKMIELISSKDQERLASKLRQIGQRNIALDAALMEQVAGIIDEVQARGDAALVEYTERFDELSLQPSELRVKEETLREFAAGANASVIEGLREAIARVRRFHEAEHLESWEIEGPNGVRLGQRITAIDSVGVYVPGGTAAYPSSVVMNV